MDGLSLWPGDGCLYNQNMRISFSNVILAFCVACLNSSSESQLLAQAPLAQRQWKDVPQPVAAKAKLFGVSEIYALTMIKRIAGDRPAAAQTLWPHAECKQYGMRPCGHDPFIVETLWASGKQKEAMAYGWKLISEHSITGRAYAYDGWEAAEAITSTLVRFAQETNRVEELRLRVKDLPKRTQWHESILEQCEIILLFRGEEYSRAIESLYEAPNYLQLHLDGFKDSGDPAARLLLKEYALKDKPTKPSSGGYGGEGPLTQNQWKRLLIKALAVTGSRLAIPVLVANDQLPIDLGRKFPKTSVLAWERMVKIKRAHYTKMIYFVEALRHNHSLEYLVQMLEAIPQNPNDNAHAAKARVVFDAIRRLSGETFGTEGWSDQRILSEASARIRTKISKSPLPLAEE